jgi:hypothetical protein
MENCNRFGLSHFVKYCRKKHGMKFYELYFEGYTFCLFRRRQEICDCYSDSHAYYSNRTDSRIEIVGHKHVMDNFSSPELYDDVLEKRQD